MSFITGWISNKVSEYAKTGLQAGGSMAGNAVGGVGTMVENAGRSAGGGVSGSIGNVGSYINGYGESIQRSMSSDGPVSTPQKKTAVKPSGAQAQKALPQAQKKALPAAGGGANKAVSSAKGAGSTAQKSASPATRNAPRPAANNKPSPSPNTRSAATNSSAGIKKPANNANTSAASQRMGQQTNQTQNKNTDGKVKVSAASRPRPGMKSTAGASKPPVKGLDPKKHDSQDPLGMGGAGG